ncbi:hypothetical protein [Paludibacterium denitrificans]|uniref:hypothetical protein n=1 Tax=Paludibacterium denitrificans TaxID=2675226 RepID=UPI001E57160C|nr:hypothetical protein [Paludibacterium denitrificans]
MLAIGLIATALFSLKMKQQVDNDAVKQFAHASDQITLKIRDRLAAQELILRGAMLFSLHRTIWITPTGSATGAR